MKSLFLAMALFVPSVCFGKDKEYQIGTYIGRGSPRMERTRTIPTALTTLRVVSPVRGTLVLIT
jgi:hypothetical protein